MRLLACMQLCMLNSVGVFSVGEGSDGISGCLKHIPNPHFSPVIHSFN